VIVTHCVTNNGTTNQKLDQPKAPHQICKNLAQSAALCSILKQKIIVLIRQIHTPLLRPILGRFCVWTHSFNNIAPASWPRSPYLKKKHRSWPRRMVFIHNQDWSNTNTTTTRYLVSVAPMHTQWSHIQWLHMRCRVQTQPTRFADPHTPFEGFF